MKKYLTLQYVTQMYLCSLFYLSFPLDKNLKNTLCIKIMLKIKKK